jgi:dsDNA-specific endonuclease/ATPase MutS2
MLELQLSHFERMLQIGIRQRMKKLVFIHGIGQGVLRHQIWSRVDSVLPGLHLPFR